MEVVTYLQAHHLGAVVYVFFSVGMLLEGIFFLLTVIFLMVRHVVQPFPALLAVVIGAISEQLLFFAFGRKLNTFSRITKWADRAAKMFDEHIKFRTLRTLLISRFIYGIHRAILVRAGMLRLPLAQFLWPSVISTLFWIAVVGSLGYIFSASLAPLAKHLNFIDLIPVAMIALFFLVERILAKKLKKRL